MPIAVVCPACEKRFSAPDAVAGKRAKCSACGNVLIVPAQNPQPVPQTVAAKPAASKPIAPSPAAGPVTVGKSAAQPGQQPAVAKPVAQPARAVAVGKPVAQPGSQSAAAKPATQPVRKVAVGKPVAEPAQRIAVGKPVSQPGGQAAAIKPAMQPVQKVAVGKPVVAPAQSIAVGKPVAPAGRQLPTAKPAVQPRSPAAEPVLQSSGGNSLLDMLEQADSSSALPGPDVFNALSAPLPGSRVAPGRPYGRQNKWVWPVLIGSGVVAVIAIVAVGITAVVRMLPGEDDLAALFADATPRPANQRSTTVPAGYSPAAAAPAAVTPAAGAPVTEYERGIREIVVLLRESAAEMTAIVDRPTAEARVARLTENGNKLVALGNKLQAMERSRQLTPRDAQVSREVEPEVMQLVARINSEKARLEGLAVQLQMQDRFAGIAQAGMGAGPSAGFQHPIVPPQQQFGQQQPQQQFGQPQPTNPPRRGPRNRGFPHH
jgi:hypothetical protein